MIIPGIVYFLNQNSFKINQFIDASTIFVDIKPNGSS